LVVLEGSLTLVAMALVVAAAVLTGQKATLEDLQHKDLLVVVGLATLKVAHATLALVVEVVEWVLQELLLFVRRLLLVEMVEMVLLITGLITAVVAVDTQEEALA
jgi:hypothetical protein